MMFFLAASGCSNQSETAKIASQSLPWQWDALRRDISARHLMVFFKLSIVVVVHMHHFKNDMLSVSLLSQVLWRNAVGLFCAVGSDVIVLPVYMSSSEHFL